MMLNDLSEDEITMRHRSDGITVKVVRGYKNDMYRRERNKYIGKVGEVLSVTSTYVLIGYGANERVFSRRYNDIEVIEDVGI